MKPRTLVNHPPAIEQAVFRVTAEDGLKRALIPLLRGKARRAYLVRMTSGSPPAEGVALCVTGVGEEEPLVGAIHGVFKAMFRSDACLDILFPNPAMEERLQRVCRPFWDEAPEAG